MDKALEELGKTEKPTWCQAYKLTLRINGQADAFTSTLIRVNNEVANALILTRLRNNTIKSLRSLQDELIRTLNTALIKNVKLSQALVNLHKAQSKKRRSPSHPSPDNNDSGTEST